MPRISVIIPAYNAEQHLEETLRSVACQTFDDWEIVVGDDGSIDRTGEISLAHEKVELVRRDQTGGTASARNSAVARSNGELLAFLDSDDYWMPKYLERQVALYDESEAAGPGVGVVACNARILAPGGFLARTYMDAVGSPDGISLGRLLTSNPIFVSAVTPRAVFDHAGGFCTDLLAVEDHDLWIRILELGYRVVASRQALAVYRVGATSVSADFARMARNEELVYRRALDRGRLPPAETRIARRELRRRQAIGRITGAEGVSYWKALRAFPLLLRVAAENPRRWRSLPRLLSRGTKAFSTRFE
jgi:teichuronic acid biosynthesis glycosyltransferase TuaG